MSTQHECYARWCDAQIAWRFLMCRKHWRMVPSDIQTEVYTTYGAMKRGGSAKPWGVACLKARKAVWDATSTK